ncbi:MAG: glycosyltransferase [Nitrospinales bacterium]
MANGVIVIQAGAIEKDGVMHIPPHWHFSLKAYAELLPGTKLVCRKENSLKNKATLPVPEGLEAVLLEKLESNNVIERVKGYIQARRKLRDLINRAEFVGAVLPSNLGNMAAGIAIHLNKPIFVEVIGENKLYDKRISVKLPLRYVAHRYTKHIDLKVVRQADYVIYVNQNLAEVMPQKPKSYAVIPQTMIYDKDLYERKDTCAKLPIRIFSANRIVKQKGLQNLLLVVKQLRKENLDVVATLTGDGEYLPELKEQCSELDLDPYITFPGYLPVEALWQLYRESDIMVLPTLASGEGTPRCIIEAMASSCPVVASAVGGIPTVFQEAQSGTGVAMGDVNELVNAIRQIISDGDLRRGYISKGLLWASGATLEKRLTKIKAAILKAFPQFKDLPSVK